MSRQSLLNIIFKYLGVSIIKGDVAFGYFKTTCEGTPAMICVSCLHKLVNERKKSIEKSLLSKKAQTILGVVCLTHMLTSEIKISLCAICESVISYLFAESFYKKYNIVKYVKDMSASRHVLSSFDQKALFVSINPLMDDTLIDIVKDLIPDFPVNLL